MAAKLQTNFKHLKGISTFLTYEIPKERGGAIASVVGLVNLSSSFQIIALHNLPYPQIQGSLVINHHVYTEQCTDRW